ncbi:uncharacterized protein LOC126291633 [Schistocerca gregaria]|uniref:uncharacterized protein LOC126291633 n=1 Tax=Schistocerca gregaria TaxID=7010 RepID=UPI00211E0994|nr:uncharacterized protein LOC126291633 [Schistocerca gregaria]
MRCAAAAADEARLKMPRTHRRNVLASVAATAACFAVWLGVGRHTCVAHKMVGGDPDAAAGVSLWNRIIFWSVDEPPKVEFLPEDEDLIRVARPAAKPAVPRPPAATTRRRILWLAPEDGNPHIETDPTRAADPAQRYRRALEKTVLPGGGLQDWLGIPGPPLGNPAFGAPVFSDTTGEKMSAILKRSDSFPEQHQPVGMQAEILSAGRRKEQLPQGTVRVEGSKKLCPPERGTKSRIQFAVGNPSASSISPSATPERERKPDKISPSNEKEIQWTVKSQKLGQRRRVRSQFYNTLGYAAHDGSEIAVDRHKNWYVPSPLQSTKTTSNFIAVSRNVKDEDQRFLKRISAERSSPRFQEERDENKRTSFQYMGDSSSSSASGHSERNHSHNMLTQYGDTIPAADVHKQPSSRRFLKLERDSLSPGLLSSVDADATVVYSDNQDQKLIKVMLAKIPEDQGKSTENWESKHTLDGISTSHLTRRSRSPTRTTDPLGKTEMIRKIGDRVMLTHEEFSEIKDPTSQPVDNSVSEQHMVAKKSLRSLRSLDGSLTEVRENQDGLATPNGANQDTGKQRRIGRHLMGISLDEATPSHPEGTNAANDADGEMTKEEEAAAREQVFHDIVGDLLGVDGSGDGSGWGAADT